MRPVLALSLLAVAGCGGAPEPPVETTPVRGVYVETLYDGQAVQIDHEAIPGEMDAMEMAFRVADPSLLDGLAPGDKIAFRVDSTLKIVAVEPLPPDTPLALRDTTR